MAVGIERLFRDKIRPVDEVKRCVAYERCFGVTRIIAEIA